jgi:hypothetical protein
MDTARRITRLTRLTLASCFVLLGVSVTSAPASAQTTKTKTWQSSATTIGSTSTCQASADGTEACTQYYVVLLQLSKDQDDAKACLSASSWTQHPDGSRTYGQPAFGCTPIDRHGYTIDRHLDTASLEPTVVTLEELGSATPRAMTVTATWIGIGERFESEYEYHEKTSSCHVNSDYGYARREAAGSMAISGVQDSFDSASIFFSEGKSHVRCEVSE